MENSICNQDRQGAYKTVYGYFNAAAYMRIFLEPWRKRLCVYLWSCGNKSVRCYDADQSFAGIGYGSIKRRIAGSRSDDWQKAGG